MKNKKFCVKDDRKPSYLFERIERVFWTVSGVVGIVTIGYEIGYFFGWITP